MINETIAAISSGLTDSGIGIIRICGPESYQIIDKIFTNSKGQHVSFAKPYRMHYGYISTSSKGDDVSRETLDEVLVMNMKAPHSFTGDDTIEINCHGGILMMRRVLEAVLNAGARLADPGEFTKRAFLNGRLDLAQAEAVIDLINAKNEYAAAAGIRQLKGAVSSKVNELREKVLYDTAYIESALDDPEHYSLDGFSEELREHVTEIRNEISALVKTYDYGKLISDGINTVILGRPNAGKSSLLNAILGEERAIVTQIPGTTRDSINETVSLNGVTMNLMDTAGIRNTEDIVEKIGVDRALKSAGEADLILYVVDTSGTPNEDDAEIIEFINEKQIPTIVLFNKSDLPALTDKDELLSRIKMKVTTLSVSAMKAEGITELFRTIEDKFAMGEVSYNDQLTLTNMRHVELMKLAGNALDEVLNSIDAGLPEDFFTIDLMDAYSNLGLIIGKDVADDLVDKIFEEFCMGK